jgi:ATP-dependent DNA ligase
MTTDIIKPMLAQSIDQKRLPKFAEDDRYAFEQKVDGHRQMIHVDHGKVFVANRQGKAKANGELPAVVMDFFRTMKGGPYVFDGELVHRTFWLFDMPLALNIVSPDDEYRFRRGVLDAWYEGWRPNPDVRLLPSRQDTVGKLELARDLLKGGAEGVMVKDLSGPYQPGKRSKFIVKAKFTQDVDCVVVDKQRGKSPDGTPKDNIVVAVHPTGFVHTSACNERCAGLKEIGEVTALAGDKDKIQIGDVVVVKYLYCTDDDRLYQPTLPRIRDDKSPEECLMDQLRYCRKTVLA